MRLHCRTEKFGKQVHGVWTDYTDYDRQGKVVTADNGTQVEWVKPERDAEDNELDCYKVFILILLLQVLQLGCVWTIALTCLFLVSCETWNMFSVMAVHFNVHRSSISINGRTS